MGPSRPIRVLIVDDHPMVREGLRSMLSVPEIAVVGDAATADEALQRAAELRPDVVMLDVQLAADDGLAVLKRLKAARPQTSVLIVTMHANAEFVREAVRSGAAGYVLKGITRRELIAAVQAVREGESVPTGGRRPPRRGRGVAASAGGLSRLYFIDWTNATIFQTCSGV